MLTRGCFLRGDSIKGSIKPSEASLGLSNFPICLGDLFGE
jgi:hypothetical protein